MDVIERRCVTAKFLEAVELAHEGNGRRFLGSDSIGYLTHHGYRLFQHLLEPPPHDDDAAYGCIIGVGVGRIISERIAVLEHLDEGFRIERHGKVPE